jgi:hypothetical protein
MVEAQVKTLTNSHELPRKRACTPSMHRRSLHTMGLHGAQNIRSKMKLDLGFKRKIVFHAALFSILVVSS